MVKILKWGKIVQREGGLGISEFKFDCEGGDADLHEILKLINQKLRK